MKNLQDISIYLVNFFLDRWELFSIYYEFNYETEWTWISGTVPALILFFHLPLIGLLFCGKSKLSNCKLGFEMIYCKLSDLKSEFWAPEWVMDKKMEEPVFWKFFLKNYYTGLNPCIFWRQVKHDSCSSSSHLCRYKFWRYFNGPMNYHEFLANIGRNMDFPESVMIGC